MLAYPTFEIFISVAGELHIYAVNTCTEKSCSDVKHDERTLATVCTNVNLLHLWPSQTPAQCDYKHPGSYFPLHLDLTQSTRLEL
jgi:hypothetical protein